MSKNSQAPRGMQDLLPQEWAKHRWIEDSALRVGKRFGYSGVETPKLEFTDLFHRGLGETSDMVSKETYTFQDRSGDSLTLRPEGTAGLLRAVISNGVQQDLPLKWMYMGPMFRHERPQKGRLREFHQIGAEALGYIEPWIEAETIALGQSFLRDLGLQGRFRLLINSVGDVESRQRHREKFVHYLTPYFQDLSSDSQIRFAKNPLRIFDSKDARDQEILSGAPTLQESLSDLARAHFEEVLEILGVWGIDFEVCPRLVRGIDYYTHSVFEFVTEDLGAQGTLLAGGRYDSLLKELGGPDQPGVGWGAGVERLALMLPPAEFTAKGTLNSVCVFAFDRGQAAEALRICQKLRAQDWTVEYLGVGSPGKKMKKANKLQARWVCFIGEAEMQKQEVQVKNMETGEQSSVSWSQISNHLKIT
ncbi:MAG: histidine--tRNA ligase [Bdellovibrio sp.]